MFTSILQPAAALAATRLLATTSCMSTCDEIRNTFLKTVVAQIALRFLIQLFIQPVSNVHTVATATASAVAMANALPLPPSRTLHAAHFHLHDECNLTAVNRDTFQATLASTGISAGPPSSLVCYCCIPGCVCHVAAVVAAVTGATSAAAAMIRVPALLSALLCENAELVTAAHAAAAAAAVAGIAAALPPGNITVVPSSLLSVPGC